MYRIYCRPSSETKLLFFLIPFIVFSCGNKTNEHNSITTLNPTEQKQTVKRERDEAPVRDEKSSHKDYKTITLMGNKLQVSIPSNFREMSLEMKQSKYPRSNSPDIVYTNQEATVNVAFKLMPLAVTENNILELQTKFFQQLQTGKSFDLHTRMENVNGANFVVYEFMSQAIDTKIYNLMFFTEVEGKMLLGTFNCTEVLKNDWKSKAEEILHSVRKI